MTLVEDGKRNSYAFIDLCKVICIFLIVMNHLSASYVHISYMKSFRIPLFFFAAGFLFSLPKYTNTKVFLKDRFKRLIIPYFVYYTLAMAIEYGFMLLRRPDQFVLTQFIKHLVGGFYSVGTSEWMIAIPLWFLTCLFSVELFYLIAAKNIKKQSRFFVVMVCLSCMGYALYKFNCPRLPWNFDIAFMALPFFSAGHLMKDFTAVWMKVPPSFRFVWGLLFFLLNLVGSKANDFGIMSLRSYGDYGLFFINGFTGIIAMVLLTSLVPELKIVKYIGRNTLTILGMHGFMMIFILKLSSKLLGINVWNALKDERVGILITLGIFIFLIPVIAIINQYIPWLSGKQKKTLIKNSTYVNLEQSKIVQS